MGVGGDVKLMTLIIRQNLKILYPFPGCEAAEMITRWDSALESQTGASVNTHTHTHTHTHLLLYLQ